MDENPQRKPLIVIQLRYDNAQYYGKRIVSLELTLYCKSIKLNKLSSQRPVVSKN
jgi:hypothetical protein